MAHRPRLPKRSDQAPTVDPSLPNPKPDSDEDQQDAVAGRKSKFRTNSNSTAKPLVVAMIIVMILGHLFLARLPLIANSIEDEQKQL